MSSDYYLLKNIALSYISLPIKTFILLSFFLLIPSLSSSQSNRIVFEDFSVRDGLIHNLVEYIHIDNEGYIWLATYTGLQKFDGYEFQRFLFNPDDSTSISDNFITTIFEDRSGNIWIGTFSNGICMYKKDQEIFHHYKHNPDHSNTLSNNNIPRGKKSIVQDKDGYLWINTRNGLNRIDVQKENVQRFYGDFEGHIIYDNDEHALWIIHKNLKKFSLTTKKLEYYDIPKNNNNEGNLINTIILDIDRIIWMGSDQGIILFDRKSKSFYDLAGYLTQSDNKYEYSWSQYPTTSIYEDHTGQIWFGIGKSAYQLNKSDGTFKTFTYESGNPNSLIDEQITGIYGNKKGIIWITYLNRGMSKVYINTKNFKHYRHIPMNQQSLSGNTVRSVFLDKKGELWIGTYNNGLNRLPGQSMKNIIHYRHNSQSLNSINSDYITAILVDSKETLWIGTFEDGLCYAENIYSSHVLEFTRFKPEEILEIHEFTEDKSGRIWISTQNGFYIYNHINNELVQYGNHNNHKSELKNINIQSVLIRPPNVFWLATWNRGLCKLTINSDTIFSPEKSEDELIIFDRIKDNNNTILDNRFITIYEDDSDNIWLGSNVNGLIKVKEINDSLVFSKYDKTNGAPDNSVFGIAGDKKGNIWISTSDGIGKFNPENEQFINYYENDGLQSNVFMWDASFKSKDDQIFFGGINGLTAFFPDSIEDNESGFEVYISKLIIHNREVKIGEKINNRTILAKNIRYSESITLTHKEPVFSLEFLTLGNFNLKKNLYAYKLEGFDDSWNVTTSERRYVTYTNLNPDTYVFKVKATNSNGIWNEDVASLLIIIQPPFWKTWWAYTMYVIIFILLLYLLQLQTLKFAKLKHSLEIEQIHHEKDNEVFQMQLKFFTNLSHEFRTPLTLILGPIEKILKSNQGSRRIRQQLELVNKNVKRLLKLTNQLLNFRKFENEKLNLNAAKGNIIKFTNEIAIAFRQHAKLHQIDYLFDFQEKKIVMWYDRDKLEIILFNLISNAFKFTPPHGNIKITVRKNNSVINKAEESPDGYSVAEFGDLPESSKEWVEISVKDSGCGISKDHIHKIFKRYYQVDQPDFENVPSSGIGLEQVKNLVEISKGKIKVISKEEVGTEFVIYLPAGSDHLKETEIIQNFKNSEHIDHYRIPQDSKEDIDETQKPKLVPELIKEDKPVVLIIEDNPDIIIFLKEILKKEYGVLEASDGKQGYDIAIKEIPDIIISDVMMPEMDGMELCVKLRSNIITSHIPIILLTARTSIVYKIEGLEAGADDYITKPFDTQTLKARILNLIVSRKRLSQKFREEFLLKPKDIIIHTPDEKFLDQIIRIIEENIADPDFNVEKLSRTIGMSHSLIYKKLKALTDQNIVEFIRAIKLKRAAQILAQTKISISEVSSEVGFTDPKYFSKCFQKHFDKTPTDYASQYHS